MAAGTASATLARPTLTNTASAIGCALLIISFTDSIWVFALLSENLSNRVPYLGETTKPFDKILLDLSGCPH